VNTPGYWPAAFQAITLTSKAISNADNIKETRESEFTDVTSNPPGQIRINTKRVVLGGLVQGLVFENATVRFTPNVRLINDVFINCVFIFPIDSQSPPKQLQQIGKELLASDLSKVTLNAS
jgi:hypothetical protein